MKFDAALKDILEILYVDELKDIADSLDVPATGNKKQIIRGIVDFVPYKELISSLKADILRAICEAHDLKAGKKEAMVSAIIQYIEENSAEAEKPIEYMDVTIENVITKLKDLTITDIEKEEDVENEVKDYLSYLFRDVASQYFLGGYLGLKIDLDIDNGKVGIETKLAGSLLNNSSEIYRMIGQGVYYQKKRYGDNLVMVVAGTEEELEKPLLREALSFLSSINIKCVPVQIEE